MRGEPTTAYRPAAATAIRSKRRVKPVILFFDHHVGAAVVPRRDDRRIPYTLVGDVVAGHAVDAGRHRKLVPARALRGGDFERGAFVLRCPRDDAAGVVAL